MSKNKLIQGFPPTINSTSLEQATTRNKTDQYFKLFQALPQKRCPTHSWILPSWK